VSKRRPVSEEDAALFRDAAGDVREIPQDREPVYRRRPEARPRPRLEERPPGASRDTPAPSIRAPEREGEQLFVRPGLQQKLVRRLRRGQIPIAAETDLHGMRIREAHALLEREIPDVLVTDLGLGDGSGNSLIRKVTRADPKALAMVITVFGDERSLVESIEAGATGYLLKSSPFSEIAPAILDLVRGGSPISAPIARYLLRRFRPSSSPVAGETVDDSPAPPLTGREAEVLRLAAKGFQFGEIAEALGISSHTVTTHIRHIYRKLDVHSRGAAVHEAVSRGIIDL